MDSKLSGVQTFLASLLLDQLLRLTVTQSLFSAHELLSWYATYVKTMESLWSGLQFLRISQWFWLGKGVYHNGLQKPITPRGTDHSFFQKKYYMGISKIKTVHWQMVQVMISSEKTKETQRQQGCQLEVTKVTLFKGTSHFPYQNRKQWFLICSWSGKNLPASIKHSLHY